MTIVDINVDYTVLNITALHSQDNNHCL